MTKRSWLGKPRMREKNWRKNTLCTIPCFSTTAVLSLLLYQSSYPTGHQVFIGISLVFAGTVARRVSQPIPLVTRAPNVVWCHHVWSWFKQGGLTIASSLIVVIRYAYLLVPIPHCVQWRFLSRWLIIKGDVFPTHNHLKGDVFPTFLFTAHAQPVLIFTSPFQHTEMHTTHKKVVWATPVPYI